MTQQINLFNPIFLKKKKHFSATAMAQALGAILLGAAALSAYTNYQVSVLSKEAGKVSEQMVAVQAQLNKINVLYGLKEKNKAIEEDIKKAEDEIWSLQQIFETLKKGDLGNTSGYSEYMRAFARQMVQGVWLTGFSIHGAGTEIGLEGRALQPSLVPAYLSRLKSEPSLQGKSFAALQMQNPPVEQSTKNSTTAADKGSAAAPYIEFVLQSSGVLKEQSELAGEKAK